MQDELEQLKERIKALETANNKMHLETAYMVNGILMVLLDLINSLEPSNPVSITKSIDALKVYRQTIRDMFPSGSVERDVALSTLNRLIQRLEKYRMR